MILEIQNTYTASNMSDTNRIASSESVIAIPNKRNFSETDAEIDNKKQKRSDEIVSEDKGEEVVELVSNQSNEIFDFDRSNITQNNIPDTTVAVEDVKAGTTSEDANLQPEQPRTSQTDSAKSKRDKCWYGESCFRKNPSHRAIFSHPGDADYEAELNSTQPICPYGAICYRKNLFHRQEFSHPRPYPARQKRKINTCNSYQEMADDDDDPYADDGESSDEYNLNSDSSNSDDFYDDNLDDF